MPRSKAAAVVRVPAESMPALALRTKAALPASPAKPEPYAHLLADLKPIYGISRSMAYRLFAEKKLTPFKFAGRTVVRAADVRALIEAAPVASIRGARPE
jgi:hypothetical protein